MRQALALIPTTFVLVSALACGNFGGTPTEEPLLTPADATTPAAIGEASAECCCAYIQESNGEKAYDHMVASNCTSWGFECVDEGFCDGTAAQVDDPAAAAVAVPTPAPAATPAPAPTSTRPAPAPAPARTMTRPGSSTAPSSGSAGGMSRPSSGGSTRPSSSRPSSTRPSSGGGMTRPR